MFWIITIFVLVSQLLATTSSLSCLECAIDLDPYSSSVINTTNCRHSTSFRICKATLLAYHGRSNSDVVIFGGDSSDYADVLNGTTMISQEISIFLDQDTIARRVEVFCYNNDSCLEDIKKIYEKSKWYNERQILHIIEYIISF